jgi:hypothetical protein
MPILTDTRKTKKISIPSIKGSELEIWDDVLTEDVETLDQEPTQMGKGIAMLSKLIRSWNLTDDKNVLLPISKETLRKIPKRDMEFLLDGIWEAWSAHEDKKKANLKK